MPMLNSTLDRIFKDNAVNLSINQIIDIAHLMLPEAEFRKLIRKFNKDTHR